QIQHFLPFLSAQCGLPEPGICPSYLYLMPLTPTSSGLRKPNTYQLSNLCTTMVVEALHQLWVTGSPPQGLSFVAVSFIIILSLAPVTGAAHGAPLSTQHSMRGA